MAKDYSKSCASERKQKIADLWEDIAGLEDLLDSISPEQIKILEEKKDALSLLTQEHTKGVMFRSKSKWMMEGEMNTSYFYSLEKMRYNAKTSKLLLDENLGEVTDQTDILNMEWDFYAALYQKDDTVNF